MVPAASAGAATVTYETRDLYPTGLEVGPSDTLYIPFVFYDEATGQNTWGGFIRCLDGTVAATKWTFVSSSLPVTARS